MKTPHRYHDCVLRLRIPRADKHRAEVKARSLGISTSGLMRMALRQITAAQIIYAQPHG